MNLFALKELSPTQRRNQKALKKKSKKAECFFEQRN
jgi:hypothetical protein